MTNSERIKEMRRKRDKLNRAHINERKRNYYTAHKEQILKRKRELTKTENYKIQARAYQNRQRKLDKSFALSGALRNRLRKALKAQNAHKQLSAMKLIGCSMEIFKSHLESKFYSHPSTGEMMTWNNYGYGNNKWHIDHIIPCVGFNLIDIEQQKICFHYTNLQPLWQPDNFSKGKVILEKQ